MDIIAADGTLATQAAKRATVEIPIVMVRVGDPVVTRLIATLARPGGNVTGISSATADLEQLDHLHFVISLKTARAIGLTIPQSVLARADDVVQ